MIRPFTCVCLLLSAGSGLYLYQSKHRAQMLDRQIEHVLKQADATRERAGVLRAEYTLLNDPQRLKDLAGQHLTLATTAPTQFVAWADFARRLPPVGMPPPAEPEPELASFAAPASAAIPVARAEPPRPDPAKPDAGRATAPRVATAVAAPAAVAPAAVRTPPPAAPAPRPALMASAAAPALAPAAPARSVLAAAPVAGPRMPAYQPPPATAAEAIARIARGGPVDPSSPVVASALGMARSMMRAPNAVAPASAAVYPLGSGG